MQNDNLIREFQKNASEKVRVERGYYRGIDIISFRIYFNAGVAKDDWRPSRKGISMRVDLLPEIKKAIDKAYEEWQGQTNKKKA